jgi:Xaa-Pro dipeptidase
MAYPVIAGAGENASTLHYIENSADLAGNDLVVVDAGCEYKGYASDITRTLPISGRFWGKAAEIHGVVQDMQEACIAAAKPGKPFYELHVLAADIALDGLLELGILMGNREKIRRQGTVSAFFPHGLGHHVGLEVHDVSGDLPLMGVGAKGKMGAGAKRETMSAKGLVGLMDAEETATRSMAPLEPGMVVTIEPGM